MSEVLVVFYSYTGTSRSVAERLAAERAWPLAEVRDAVPRTGALRCVLDSLFRRRPPIRYDGPDPGAFDAVVLVAPIWTGRLAGPMRSFVAAHAARLRDVAVVPVMGGQGAPKAVAEVAALVGRPPILDAAFQAREVADGSGMARVAAFARAVERIEANAGAATRPATWSPVAG